MASFYGNIKNNSRSSFIFDRIYSSRTEMDTALKNTLDENGAIQGDGVFINRYVLIDYGYSAAGAYLKVDTNEVNNNNLANYYYKSTLNESQMIQGNYDEYGHEVTNNYNATKIYYRKVHYMDRYSTVDYHENDYYAQNRELDAGNYFASYDHTVWMKIYSDNQEKYILVAELDAAAPTYELITDAPDTFHGAPHFDLSLSTDLNYVYHVPKNWDLILNTYKPEERENIKQDNANRHYWYYECDLEDQDTTFDLKEEYPFYNKKGLSKTTRVIKPTNNEKIDLIKTKSGNTYPIHQFRQIGLTKDTYTPNRYFTLNTNAISQIENAETENFDINKAYYVAVEDNPTEYTLCPIVYNGEKYIPALQLSNGEKYYIRNGSEEDFVLSISDYLSTETYFELTTMPIGPGKRTLTEEKDTQRLDIYLPSIGNAVATMYDAIYGKPRYAIRKIIGYTNDTILPEYQQDDFGGYEIDTSQYTLDTDQVNNLQIPVYDRESQSFLGYITYEIFARYEQDNDGQYLIFDKPYSLKSTYDPETDLGITAAAENTYDIPVYQLIDNIIGYTKEEIVPLYTTDENGPYKIQDGRYNLTDDDISKLSPEFIPGSYDVPVYAYENINARPYDDDKLFGKLAPPYENVTDGDNVSMGWALDALKKYISELRYLANGRNGPNALGLQSDWTLDDDQSFGYIYHKPDIITTFTLSSDESFISGKKYYTKQINNNVNSADFGYEQFKEVDQSTVSEGNPSSLMYYEIPKTMTKNAETEFYYEESVVGYIETSDLATFEELTKTQDDRYIKISDNEEIVDQNRIFIINNKYYYITIEQVNNLQHYAGDRKTIQVVKLNTTFNSDGEYFINNGSRYIRAFQTIGSYTIQPITSTQYGENCLCYFAKSQQIIVENGEIVKRKYTFNSYGDVDNNIYLMTGEFHNGEEGHLDNNIEFTNKRINQFNIIIDTSNIQNSEIEEFPINDDFEIKVIENMTRQQLIAYLLDNDVNNTYSTQINNEDILLPYATFEILKVYNEEFGCYKNRNNNKFDFNQYVVSISQQKLNEDYWDKTRKVGTVYYLRDYRPIEQIDYEINTIWNSIQVND